MIVATYGFTRTFFHPDLTSATVCPGSNQNSWNINLANLVAVSSDVKQNAEYVKISRVFNTFTTPSDTPIVEYIWEIPPANIAVAPFVMPCWYAKLIAQIVKIASTHSSNIPPYAIGLASDSLFSCLDVVPDDTKEWKPEIAPQATVVNNTGNKYWVPFPLLTAKPAKAFNPWLTVPSNAVTSAPIVEWDKTTPISAMANMAYNKKELK